MGVNINGGINIGSGGILISAPYIPPSSFNFTLNQVFSDTAVIIQSIGGFTSTPAFTSTASPFVFNSTGISFSPVTFTLTAYRPGGIATGQAFDLYKNGIFEQILFAYYGVLEPVTLTYNPITVSTNDSILIYGYYYE